MTPAAAGPVRSAMLLLDANVLIRSFRADIDGHAEVSRWLERVIADQAPFGFPDGILMSFVRIVTQRPFDPVTPVELALEFAEALRSAPSCVVLPADQRQWETFSGICRRLRAHGRRAQDLYWASFALSHGGEWITFDEGFADVPQLRWRTPFDNQPRTNPR